MSKAPAWLLLLLTPLGFVLAVQPARQEAMRAELAQTEALLNDGYRWQLNEAESLVGGQPVGVDSWTFGPAGLTLTQASSTTYVPLNFGGRTLPAEKLSRLYLMVVVSQPVKLRLWHRASLEGPAARSEAVNLRPDQPSVVLNLKELHWTVDGRESSWGQGTGSVATLRIHPAHQPVDVTLLRVHLGPEVSSDGQINLTAALGDGSRSSTDAAPNVLEQGRAAWSPSALRRALNGYRADPSRWTFAEPPSRALPGWTAYLLVVGTLLCSMVWRRCSAAAALMILVVSLWWVFSQAAWQAAGAAACVMALALCSLVRHSPAAREALDRLMPAPRSVGYRIDLLRLTALLVFLLACLLLTDSDRSSWGLEPARWLTYLAWAAVQQWMLCTVLYPLGRLAGAGAATAIAIAALIFGFSHLPNLELMLMTWLLALGCVWHYSRHRRLLAPIALHGIAGTVLLVIAPTPLLYSASAGPGFWS